MPQQLENAPAKASTETIIITNKSVFKLVWRHVINTCIPSVMLSWQHQVYGYSVYVTARWRNP